MKTQVDGPIDIYARQSKKTDPDQTTTASQIAVCRAELEERGLTIGEVWIDDGTSAWNPKVYRKDWNALMKRLESGAAAGVIVYDLERFARQVSDGERLVTAADRGLIVLDSEGEYDLRRPGDKKNFRNAIVAAEYYCDLLKVKVRRGKAAKARKGKVDQRRSFGFEDDGETIIESEAAIIRDHATRLLAGETQDSLIQELNDTGVTSVHGKQWSYTTYREVMTRPRNAGLIVHDGTAMEGVRLPGEPILDRLIHDRIVALYSARRWGRPPSGRYVLTGIAKCGQPGCDAPLGGRPHPRDSGKGLPEPRRQYWCRKCRKTYVSASHLDVWAADWAVKELSDPEKANIREAEQRELEEARQALLTEQAGIEQTLTEIAGRLGRREISLPRHDAICDPLDERLKEITAGLAWLVELPESAPPPDTRTLAEADPGGYQQISWLDHWDSGTPAERRAMVLRALRGRRIVVGKGTPAAFDPDRVTVH